MYAVIRSGGKQYRVAPGDVIRVERTPASDGNVEFGDILAISGDVGQIGRPNGDARVVGRVVEEGRADKVLVFHYKRKKQYKKLRGHRQGFTAVRITEIAFDGQRFTAPEEEKRQPKPRSQQKKTAPATSPAAEAADVTASPEEGANVRKSKQKGAVKAQAAGSSGKGGSRPTGKKSAGKTAGPARSAAKKSAGKGGDKGKKGGKK
jgi:large subunit ribosomal protein L21